MGRFVVGVSGASGIVLAYRTLDALTQLGHEVVLVMTKDASVTALEELGAEKNSPEKWLGSFSLEQQKNISVYKNNDFFSPIASGSHATDGMVIIPCSMATLAAVSLGLGDNLLRRAADVTLKERRHLVVVPREAPFSEIHLEHMLRLSKAGASIVPPIPAWYTHPKSLEDVELFIVGRVLDALRVPSDLYPRWNGVKERSSSL